MYSNENSAVQRRRNHSTLDIQFLKESVMNITHAVRRNAISIAWVMLACAPITMVAEAQAGESADDVPHKVVSFRDLNLDTPEGAAVLYRRITSAAYEVCRNPESFDLSQGKLLKCVKDAMSRAVADVNRPTLTSLYEAKTGKVKKQEPTLAQAH